MLTKIDLGQISKIVKTSEERLSSRIDGVESNLDKKINKIDKKLDYAISFLDKENIKTVKRVEKIEQHLNISPPPQF